MYAIETKDLTKRFPLPRSYKDLLSHPFRKQEITALEKVYLQIAPGEIFSLVGPNGAGKSTLIRVLSTLILPSGGRAWVNGCDVVKEGDKVRQSIGYVMNEERSFYWRLTGRQNLEFFAVLNNIPVSRLKEKVDEVVELVGLGKDIDRMFKDYSTGMRQRLSIARGLLTGPRILLVDEPTKSLDPEAARELRRFLKEEIAGRQKRTVFMATHNLGEAEDLSHKIAIIHKGVIRACGTLREIRRFLERDKREFYLLHLHNPSRELLVDLGKLPWVKELRALPSEPDSPDTEKRFEIIIEGGRITDTLRSIIQLKGRIIAFYRKKRSLEEIFSEVIGGKGK